MRDFDGRIVLVTGASTGLGAAIAVGAAARGAKAVIINYARSAAEAEATAAAVRAAGAEAVLAQGDVGDDEACRAIVEKAKTRSPTMQASPNSRRTTAISMRCRARTSSTSSP
jgi:3-oxoacyl-[acyl-carrier protein] reductase